LRAARSGFAQALISRLITSCLFLAAGPPVLSLAQKSEMCRTWLKTAVRE